MKKLLSTLLVLLCMTSFTSAQEKKAFTLDDVIPGGNNYYNLIPKNLPGLQWWGNICVRTNIDDIKEINNRTGKETVLVTLEDVNKALQKGEKTYKLSLPIKKLHSLQRASLPWGDKSVIMFAGKVGNDNESTTYMFFYDFRQKELINIIREGEIATAVNPEETKEETSNNIIYGQAVHRNEFGITKGTFWSPNGSFLAFYRMDQSMVTDYPQVNTTTRIATLVPDKYPMAGTVSHKVTIGIYNIETGKIIYLQAGDPTDRYFTNISWSPDEKNIYVIELNRDQNHAQLVQYNAETGEKQAILYEEKHSKYVEPQHPIVFLPWDNTKFIYWSQRDGYHHLYLMNTQKPQQGKWETGKDTDDTYCEYLQTTPLTQGDWLVQQILGFNTAKKEIIISSTEISPLQTNIFSLNIKNKKRSLIGNENGMHSALLSKDGTYLIDYFTSNEVPREINILPTNGNKGVNLLTATDPMKEQYNLPEISIGTLKAADGKTDLYYRLIKPVNFDPNKKYPAIIYVYGGPHAQMIHNTRFYDARGWDLYMAQQGYVMLTVDGRGSDNRGLLFENCTFRELGTEEMKDQVEGAKFLQSLPYVDDQKIGVHGWSFGGFMTTNLMLTYPDIFKVGVAGGPVIDWQFYEIMYGERYMDMPQTNPEGYKNSNLRNKAGNLKGRLEIIIGGMDPTCVPQHTITFLRACIDAGTHPDLFIYPEDGHNMVGHDRVHLHEHITRYFIDHLK